MDEPAKLEIVERVLCSKRCAGFQRRETPI
jgi:hypothetical protein